MQEDFVIQKLYKLTLLGVLTLGVAGANTIVTVNNPSFETANAFTIGCVQAGCFFNQSGVPSWTSTGDAGSLQPGLPVNPYYFNNLPDGTITAYVNGGSLSQTVGVTAQAGQTYSLVVALGLRADASVFGGSFTGAIQLQIGNTVVNGVGSQPTAGNWSDYTATYAAQQADQGQSITIRLLGNGVQGNFDHVRLSFAPTPGFTPPGGGGGNNEVPEPSAVMLTGLGLAGLVAVRQRLRR